MCKTCRDWHFCRGFPWYAPGDIESQFCFNMLFWVILHARDLAEGVYPPDPRPTGYTGGSSSRFSATAKFKKAADIYTEYSRRLSRTGDKGKVLIHEVTVLGAESVNQLSQPAREALGYIAGREAKRTGFSQWLATRELRRRARMMAKVI